LEVGPTRMTFDVGSNPTLTFENYFNISEVALRLYESDIHLKVETKVLCFLT